VPGIHQIGGWVGAIASLDFCRRGNLFPLLGLFGIMIVGLFGIMIVTIG